MVCLWLWWQESDAESATATSDADDPRETDTFSVSSGVDDAAADGGIDLSGTHSLIPQHLMNVGCATMCLVSWSSCRCRRCLTPDCQVTQGC